MVFPCGEKRFIIALVAQEKFHLLSKTYAFHNIQVLFIDIIILCMTLFQNKN